jgi:hypothetical protein
MHFLIPKQSSKLISTKEVTMLANFATAGSVNCIKDQLDGSIAKEYGQFNRFTRLIDLLLGKKKTNQQAYVEQRMDEH